MTLSQTLTVGPHTRIEFRREGAEGYVDVELPREAYVNLRDRLGLVPGSRVHLRPRRITRFAAAALGAAALVGGGLAPTNERSPRAVDDRVFLEQLWAAGMADCLDVLAVHAYGFGLSPDVPDEVHNHLNLGRIAQMWEITQAAGVEKPIWITELGYTVVDGNQTAVSEAQQADYLLAAQARAATEWPWVELPTVVIVW